LISRTHIYRPPVNCDKITIAPQPFVIWKPGDTADHLAALAMDGSDGGLCGLGRPFLDGPTSSANVSRRRSVLAYIAIPPRRHEFSTQSQVSELSCRVEVRSPAPGEQGASYQKYRQHAYQIAEHELHVAAIYLRTRKEKLETHRQWCSLGIRTEGTLGRVPDALVCDRQGNPVLALAFSGPLTDLLSIHHYCDDRGLPYELWGSLFDNGWYNPDAQRQRTRDRLLDKFGPIPTIPAISRMPSDPENKEIQ
jgi:hypothetical protein